MLTARSCLRVCKYQAGKIERFYAYLVQQKILQALQDSAINKNSTVYTSTPPRLPDPPFQILEGLAPRLWARLAHARDQQRCVQGPNARLHKITMDITSLIPRPRPAFRMCKV